MSRSPLGPDSDLVAGEAPPALAWHSTPHRRPVLDASFSADGRLVVTACKDGTARFWPVDLMETAERYSRGHIDLFGGLPSPGEDLWPERFMNTIVRASRSGRPPAPTGRQGSATVTVEVCAPTSNDTSVAASFDVPTDAPSDATDTR
jgi:WD40 repeat protein